MQRYFVVACDPNVRVQGMVRYEVERLVPGTGRVYGRPQRDTTEDDVLMLDRKQTVYYFDSMTDAIQGAKELCQKNGGIEYVVCTANSVYVAPPGEVVTKTFSDKGLVPS
jgi:hypothetical protein